MKLSKQKHDYIDEYDCLNRMKILILEKAH